MDAPQDLSARFHCTRVQHMGRRGEVPGDAGWTKASTVTHNMIYGRFSSIMSVNHSNDFTRRILHVWIRCMDAGARPHRTPLSSQPSGFIVQERNMKVEGGRPAGWTEISAVTHIII